jgi:hypothetical protein
MQRRPILSAAALAAALVAGTFSAACGNDEKAVPAAEIQSQTPVQATNQPTTITGCLRAGESTGTFVLTTTQTAQEQTATYQLTPAQNVDLASNVGQRVEVNGVIRTQQEIAARTKSTPADDRATGTSGTPNVQTTTEVSIKQLDVSAVRPLGDRCDG